MHSRENEKGVVMQWEAKMTVMLLKAELEGAQGQHLPSETSTLTYDIP